jgi:hypothetical protein
MPLIIAEAEIKVIRTYAIVFIFFIFLLLHIYSGGSTGINLDMDVSNASGPCYKFKICNNFEQVLALEREFGLVLVFFMFGFVFFPDALRRLRTSKSKLRLRGVAEGGYSPPNRTN